MQGVATDNQIRPLLAAIENLQHANIPNSIFISISDAPIQTDVAPLLAKT